MLQAVFVAEIVEDEDGLAAANPFVEGGVAPVPLVVGASETGDFAEVETSGGVAKVRRLVAPAGSAMARLYQLLAQRHIDPVHPPDVQAEVAQWLRRTGVDDPELADLTEIPFVTIDGIGTRDLDQALHVAREGSGYRVRYALADASYYVRPGSALFREALRRGASYYLPGLSVPMLPRALSEGLISLNPRVNRRATVFEMRLDADGQVESCRVVRARVHSRARLTFAQVEAFLDGRVAREPWQDDGVFGNLRAFEEVGKLRLAHAQRGNMVPHRTGETRVRLDDGRGVNFVAIERMRNRVERYSEQLSLMCNIEGASLLRRAASETIQPIFRTHAPPDAARLRQLQDRITAVARLHGLDGRWVWDPDAQSLGEFIRRLPGDADREYLRQALQHQAILVNVRSMFTAEPGPHFGIGADVYARFSAPMREIVGIYVHRELWDLLEGSTPSSGESLRDAVIEAANRSRQLQRDLTHEANRLVLDQFFEPELGLDRAARPRRRAVVLGFRGTKIYVRLLDPPIELKVYAEEFDLSIEADRCGAALLRGGDVVCRLGELVEVRLRERDERRDRWILELV